MSTVVVDAVGATQHIRPEQYLVQLDLLDLDTPQAQHELVVHLQVDVHLPHQPSLGPVCHLVRAMEGAHLQPMLPAY